MIKKLVTLGVGFVFAFVAIFFSVRSVDVVAEGKGSGKDATVKDPKEFGTVLATLPDADYYEGLLQEEQLKNLENAGKSLAAAADAPTTATDKVRPVTVYEKSLLSSRSHSVSHKDDRRNDSDIYNYLRRTMYIYYTEDAVYYDSVGMLVSKQVTEVGPNSEYTRTTKETVLDFDAHMYIGKSGAYIKFNKWESTQSTVTGTVKNGTFTEDEKEGEDITANANATMDEVQKALKKHYGQWISVYGGELSEMPDLDDMDEMPDLSGEFDPSTMDPSKYEDMYLSYMAKLACAEAADAYYQQLVSTTANNNATFAKFAGYLKGYNESLAFEENGNFYTMTELGKQRLLENYGWVDVSTDQNGKPSVDSSYFVIDMNDQTAPAFLTNIDYDIYYSGSSMSYTLRDELGIKHLDNTVVPYTPNTKDDMYTLFGDAVKKIMKSLMDDNGQKTLLVDGLNAATEVIGR